MAMLAEPRRKQKWTLNPRGKQWSEDSNKFGQRMLEKMGWSSGKGLGANEQGMTEHVKVSYKNNQSGIGFKDIGDQWTQHQTDFNHFLSQLQEQNSNSETSVDVANRDESLELKSKQSRTRVHYHKFTRGKDVKKYSSKDLANIFGKKDLKEAIEPSKAEKPMEEIIAEPTGSTDITGGVLTVKGGNIDDYFKDKLPNFVKKRNMNITVERDSSDGEYEPKLGFGFSSTNDLGVNKISEKDKNKKENDSVTSGFAFANAGLDLDYPEKPIKSKSKKVDFVYDNPFFNSGKGEDSVKKCKVPFSKEGFVNPALNLKNSTNDENNGAEFEVSRVEFGIDNNALDLSDESSAKKRVTFNDNVEYSTDVVKKKRKKVKTKLDKFEVDNNVKKKSKETTAASEFVCSNDDAAGFVNEALDVEVISDEVNDNEMNERKSKKTKRKRNRRESNLETIEEAPEESSQLNDSNVGEAVLLDEGVPKKKKKKMEKHFEKNTNLQLELNPDFINAQGNEVSLIKKKEKKSRKSSESVDIEIEREIIVLEGSENKKKKGKAEKEAEITVLNEISTKKSKSGKKKCDSIQNDNEDEINSDIQQEIIDSTKAKKKSKKRSRSKSEINNSVTVPSLDSSNELDITNTGTPLKRKNHDTENAAISLKKHKMGEPISIEDTENLEQNMDNSVSSATSSSWSKKGKRSKKTFKSLLAKVPTLYFSGSNINEIAGYGTDYKNVK